MGLVRVTIRPITSLRIGDVWHGDRRTNHGRIIRIERITPYGTSPFDPLLSIRVLDDPQHPSDVGDGRYSRASWLQTAYRPGAA